MKNLLITLIFTFFLTNVFSQSKNFWIEYQGTHTNNSYSQLIASSFTSQKENGFGVTSFALVSPEWAELYFGPMYGFSFKNGMYVEGGLSIGIETSTSPLRTAGYLYGKKPKLWFLVNYEYGGSGDWYLGIFEYKLNDLGIGFHVQKFASHGLRFSYEKHNFKFWSVFGYEPIAGRKALTFGLKYNL